MNYSITEKWKKVIFISSQLFAKIRYVHSTEQMFSNSLNDRP